MLEYVNMVNENTQEGSFMRAVLAIRNDDFESAYAYINKVYFLTYNHKIIFYTKLISIRSVTFSTQN